jgi:3'-phosphoadenosine 5'-phosphosulfate (PAPS) 3'-phosphatase
MIDWQVPVVRDLLLEAGRIALTHFESPQTEHKADQSLVTVADTAVEEHLRSPRSRRERSGTADR